MADFCKECGSKLTKGARFCSACGYRVEVENGAETTPVPRKRKRRFLIYAFSILAGLAVAVGAVVVFLPELFQVEEIEIMAFPPRYDVVSQEMLLHQDAGGGIITIEGEEFYVEGDIYAEQSAYGDRVIYYVDNGEEAKTHDLYYIDQNLSPGLIEEKVETYFLSYAGNYVAYTCKTKAINKSGDKRGQLFVYDVENGERKKIDKAVLFKENGQESPIVFSNNGEYVLYTKRNDTKNGSDLYIAGMNHEKQKLTKACENRIRPIGVSNDGKNVYYIQYVEDDLCLYVNRDGENILLEEKLISCIGLNNDGTELIYDNQVPGTYFYDAESGKKVQLSDKASFYLKEEMIRPRWMVWDTPDKTDNYEVYIGVDSFVNCGFETDDGYWFLDEQFAVQKRNLKRELGVSRIESYTTDLGGRTILYLADGALYLQEDLITKEAPRCLYYKKNVESYCVSENYEHIFMIADDNLYCLKDRKAIKVYEDVTDVAYSKLDGRVYFVSDENLYSAPVSDLKSVRSEDEAIEIVTWRDGSILVTAEDEVYRIVEEDQVDLTLESRQEESDEGKTE